MTRPAIVVSFESVYGFDAGALGQAGEPGVVPARPPAGQRLEAVETGDLPQLIDLAANGGERDAALLGDLPRPQAIAQVAQDLGRIPDQVKSSVEPRRRLVYWEVPLAAHDGANTVDHDPDRGLGRNRPLHDDG